ncbi:MAG: hypothetical protein WCT32_03860 [Patescibacteria group bacterium]|jgi:hypothetical protein
MRIRMWLVVLLAAFAAAAPLSATQATETVEVSYLLQNPNPDRAQVLQMQPGEVVGVAPYAVWGTTTLHRKSGWVQRRIRWPEGSVFYGRQVGTQFNARVFVALNKDSISKAGCGNISTACWSVSKHVCPPPPAPRDQRFETEVEIEAPATQVHVDLPEVPASPAPIVRRTKIVRRFRGEVDLGMSYRSARAPRTERWGHSSSLGYTPRQQNNIRVNNSNTNTNIINPPGGQPGQGGKPGNGPGNGNPPPPPNDPLVTTPHDNGGQGGTPTLPGGAGGLPGSGGGSGPPPLPPTSWTNNDYANQPGAPTTPPPGAAF